MVVNGSREGVGERVGDVMAGQLLMLALIMVMMAKETEMIIDS